MGRGFLLDLSDLDIVGAWQLPDASLSSAVAVATGIVVPASFQTLVIRLTTSFPDSPQLISGGPDRWILVGQTQWDALTAINAGETQSINAIPTGFYYQGGGTTGNFQVFFAKGSGNQIMIFPRASATGGFAFTRPVIITAGVFG